MTDAAEHPHGTRPQHVAQTLDEVFRREHARVLSVLVGDLGDLDLAEEALPDTMAQAVEAWAQDGLPDRPAAWLLTVARRRGIDRIRRADAGRRAVTKLTASVEAAVTDDPYDPDTSTIPDERLKLLFTCCHPALAPSAQIALTLRTIAGLDEAAIARAFLVSESAMARRLGRVRRKIRDARSELMEEGIRLARLLVELLPDEVEAQGLLVLLLLQHARTAARTAADGGLVLLEDQDRAQWDVGAIVEGRALVRNALALGTSGPYQVQAAIAALHAEALTAAVVVAHRARMGVRGCATARWATS